MHRIKSAELVVPGTNPEHTGIRTILLPSLNSQGHIFGFISIHHRDHDVRERLFHIVSSHLEVLRADMDHDSGNVPRRFEAMLMAINTDLARLASTHTIAIKTVNIIVGVMTQNQVFFSGFGINHALFLHRTAERRYVVYELDLQLQTQETTWEKPLLTVLDGELHPGDVFYIASRLPLHALTLSDLQDIVITLPPNGALERLAQFVPPTTHFGGLCFHVYDDNAVGPPKKANPMMSLSTFEETKARTADLLGEQSPHISQKIVTLGTIIKNQLSTYSENNTLRFFKRIGRAALVMYEKITGLVQNLLRNQKKYRSNERYGTREKFRHVTNQLGTLHHAGVTAVQGASRSTKILGVTTLMVLGIIFIVLHNNRTHQETLKLAEEYEALMTTIEEKRTAAEAAIIYGNTTDAQRFIAEATSLLATAPQQTPEQKNIADELHRALNELLGQTRGLETVVPVKIAELPAQFAFPLITLENINNVVYGMSADHAPWRVNEVSKTLERLDIGISPAQNIITTTSEQESVLGVDMDKRLWRTTLASRTITSLTSGTDALDAITDLDSYNDNLYVLNAESEQIVKMRPQGLGFEAGTPWITAKTSNLNQAKALTIDGGVWVLTQDDIVVFNSGRESPWKHTAIDPALINPRDIWTDTTTDYLYILDGEDGRIVVMDKKTGGIIVQYIVNMHGVIGFVVREEENRILLATPTAVYSYTASHLLQ